MPFYALRVTLGGKCYVCLQPDAARDACLPGPCACPPCLHRTLRIQFYLSGITTDRTVRLLRRRNLHKITTTPLARPLLMVASAGNFFVGISCIANMAIYILAQDRSTSNLSSYKWPDLLGPAIGIPCSICTQAYFAIRCWKVTERNRYIAACMALSILVGLVGSSWSVTILGADIRSLDKVEM